MNQQALFEPCELIRPPTLVSPGLVAWPSRAADTGEKAGTV